MGPEVAAQDDISIEVWLDRNPNYRSMITGPADAPFLRTLSLTEGASVLDGAMIRLVDYGTDADGWDLLLIDREVTLGGVAKIFEGKPVAVVFGGIGGDGGYPWAEWPLTLWEVVNFGLSIGGIVGAAKASERWVDKIRHLDKQKAAEAWRDSDDLDFIPMELRQFVLSKAVWYRQHFDEVFGLEPSIGTRLLRSLGYEKTERNGYPAWVEKERGLRPIQGDG